MAYATLELVRQVSGLTTDDKSDADINTFIIIADEIVNIYTDKASWSPSDSGYKHVQLASALLTTWMCLKGQAGSEKKAEQARKEAYTILGNVMQRGDLLRA